MYTKKKILKIIEESKFGGPQKRISIIAKNLKKDFDILVLLPKENSKKFSKILSNQEIKYDLINIFTLRKNIKIIFKYFFFFFNDIALLRNKIKKFNPDLIHVCGGASQIRTIIASIITRKKFVWHLNDTYTPSIFFFLFQILKKFCNAFIFSSYATKNYYFNKKKVNQPFEIMQSPVIKDKLYIKKKNKIIISNISNFSPVKNLELFLQFANNFKENKNIKFYLCGKVFRNQINYYTKLKKIINSNKIKNIKIIKKFNYKDILKKTDIYLCTSTNESSPMSVWEAMNFGCSIVSTDCGDVKRYIKSFKFCNIIDLNNLNKSYKFISSFKKLNKHQMRSIHNKIISKNGYQRKIISYIQFYNYLINRN